MMPRFAPLLLATLALPALAAPAPAPSKAPTRAPAADEVQVLKAEVGLLGALDASGRQPFRPGTLLPLRDGQEFAWRLVVKTNKPFVRVREELTLPAEPRASPMRKWPCWPIWRGIENTWQLLDIV